MKIIAYMKTYFGMFFSAKGWISIFITFLCVSGLFLAILNTIMPSETLLDLSLKMKNAYFRDISFMFYNLFIVAPVWYFIVFSPLKDNKLYNLLYNKNIRK